MIGGLGLPELIIILVVALLIFGPSRLPDIGKQVGKGIREFRTSIQSLGDDVQSFGSEIKVDMPQVTEGSATYSLSAQSNEVKEADHANQS